MLLVFSISFSQSKTGKSMLCSTKLHMNNNLGIQNYLYNNSILPLSSYFNIPLILGSKRLNLLHTSLKKKNSGKNGGKHPEVLIKLPLGLIFFFNNIHRILQFQNSVLFYKFLFLKFLGCSNYALLFKENTRIPPTI